MTNPTKPIKIKTKRSFIEQLSSALEAAVNSKEPAYEDVFGEFPGSRELLGRVTNSKGRFDIYMPTVGDIAIIGAVEGLGSTGQHILMAYLLQVPVKDLMNWPITDITKANKLLEKGLEML